MSRHSFATAVAFIYGLAEPDTGRIRYIGRSEDPWRRYVHHTSSVAAEFVQEWVAQLRERHALPMLVILRPIAANEDADVIERSLISQLHLADLLNIEGVHSREPRRDKIEATPWESTRTLGMNLLNAYLRLPGNTQSKLARLLGVRQSSVSLWTYGKCRPEHDHLIALQSIAGIPLESWRTEGERGAVVSAHSMSEEQ